MRRTGCRSCARAASGHTTTALPRRVMNSRRFMQHARLNIETVLRRKLGVCDLFHLSRTRDEITNAAEMSLLGPVAEKLTASKCFRFPSLSGHSFASVVDYTNPPSG
jgi:hypothetical protein